ncbi:MAG: molybdopterin-dependent oxidoreductase [Candidatus Korobacteraceae bacterium]
MMACMVLSGYFLQFQVGAARRLARGVVMRSDANAGERVIKMGAWSAGPGCHGGCGVEVHVKDGKVTKIEGDPDHPWYHGRACPRVLAMTQYIYSPNRLRHPLKRIGARGEDKWLEISWEEAFDICETRMRELADKYGPECMLFTQGTGRDVGGMISFLAYSYGSPNWCMMGLSGHSCFTPQLAAGYITQGDFTFPDAAQFLPDRYDDPEWVAPKCVISWGASMSRGCVDHYWSGHWFLDQMRRGAKLIVIDPRCTWEASRATIWLQPRPGTDGALALAFLNVVITEKLYDKDFVDKWCHGFDKLAERVQEYTPEKVEKLTWVPAEKIRQAARMYATETPSGIEIGRPVEGNPDGTTVIMTIHDLIAITGNLDVPGGNVICRSAYGVTTYPYNTEEVIQLYGEELYTKLSEKRIGADKYPLVKSFRAWAQPDEIIKQLETGKPYPIKGVWTQANNWLANQAGDPRRHYNAIKDLDFNVVVDLFMTPTAQAVADIVLPAASFPEKDSIYCIGGPLNIIEKVIDVPECKSDWEINFTLAKRLNPKAVPWNTVKEMLTARMLPSGYTFESLGEKRWDLAPKDHACGSRPYRRYEKGQLRKDKQPGFRTPTGKVELYCTSYEKWGYDPLPSYREPGPESPEQTPEVYKEFPLIMMTGRRSPVLFHSEHRNIPWLREIDPDPLIEINPETAKEKGIENGDWVWIEGTMGKCKRKAKVTPIIHPKTVMVPHAWWLPESDGKAPHFYGVWDLNVNQLIPMGYPDKAGFGGGPLSYMLCRIRKV